MSRKRQVVVSVRLTPEEDEQLRTAAKERGVSLSQLMREAAIDYTTSRVVYTFGPHGGTLYLNNYGVSARAV